MDIGMVGLGRMGTNMAKRLQHAGHHCVVYDVQAPAIAALVAEGAAGAESLQDLAGRLAPPRAIWLMLPAGAVDAALQTLLPCLSAGDVVIDGGNSHYHDDIRRAADLAGRGIDYLDVGTSGGVWGAERGYCLMIGGDAAAVQRLDPIFAALAPGITMAPRTPGRAALDNAAEAGPRSTAEQGYLQCGPAGAGHFVKMVHNGIEYGLMAAYAEGLNLLAHANAGAQARADDAETAPLRNPAHFRYDLALADITEVWRRGSVISSWLLDLTAAALLHSPTLAHFAGRVSDSGEGRWTLQAAVEAGVPAPILGAALFQRFASRGEDEFAGKILSAMRHQFGGHDEKPASDGGTR